MKLTSNFTLKEFEKSDTASRHGRRVQANGIQICNARILTYSCLQPLRDYLNIPIKVTSGIRPVWLNTMVGGSKHSAHITGRAVDFKVPGYSPNQIIMLIKDLDLPYDKVIAEFGRWVHLQIADGADRPRKQLFISYKHDGKTLYEPY